MAAPVVGSSAPVGKRKFIHEGREIYEWEQDLSEVLIYVTPPPGVKASMIACKITATHLELGIKGNPPFLNEDTFSTVVASESFWSMESGLLTINLTKAKKGETWGSALKGHGELDALATEEVKKKMLLERFQEEHPGFDFSGAEVNGDVPDPRSFMGGIRTK